MITACLIILSYCKMIVQNIMKNPSSQRKSNITYRISLGKKMQLLIILKILKQKVQIKAWQLLFIRHSKQNLFDNNLSLSSYTRQ